MVRGRRFAAELVNDRPLSTMPPKPLNGGNVGGGGRIAPCSRPAAMLVRTGLIVQCNGQVAMISGVPTKMTSRVKGAPSLA